MRTNLLFRGILLAGISLSAPAFAADDPVPIIQPGAPGEPGQLLAPSEAIALADNRYSPGDVAYMQHMIVHHRQATEMAALVEARTTNPDIRRIARRIAASQADEMKFMTEWLSSRSEPIVMAGTGQPDHAGMGHVGHDEAPGNTAMVAMEGMASPAQMAALAAAEGTAFDRLFLELMIAHHRGAVDMTRNLLEWSGTASDPEMNQFTADVVSDQNAEITRMNKRLATLSQDPRATLKAGFRDAGEAIMGMRKLASLEKPAGFFDPDNPAGLKPLAAKSKDELEEEGKGKKGAKAKARAKKPAKASDPNDPRALAEDEKEPDTPKLVDRSSMLDFANTDMAFSGNLLVAGNYHGFNVYRLAEDGMPQLTSSVVCPGGQGDVSIAGNLLVMSVEEGRGRVDCGLQGNMTRISADRFRGLRLFDISDPAAPRQVGQVQTCRGSHTHSIVSADDRRLVIYASGTGGVRKTEELAICTDLPGDDTALFSIDVIEVPVADPAAARLVDRPRVFATGDRIAGLWEGGDHGAGTQDTSVTNQCHDITVFPAKNLAAGACSGNGIVLDISDPLKPRRIDDVTDKGFAYWHSATFNNDGTKVLFTDEWGGGGRPRCQAGDPSNWGANAFYAIEDGQLVYRGTYKLPAPQSDKENCVAHNGSIIPVPGRDIFVQAWYQGGISVIDFTDPANVREIAYFDRGPVDKDQLVTGGYWSAYWYKGRIYATEIARGLDVFALTPSEFLTPAEIAAAEAAQYQGDVFNPQTQTQVTWPAGVAAAAEASRKGG